MKDQKSKSSDIIVDESGQTFLEFVLLLATMVLLSFTLLRGFNSGISKMWQGYIQAIAKPTTSTIDF